MDPFVVAAEGLGEFGYATRRMTANVLEQGEALGKKRKSKTLLPRVAETWRPYRSVASWYLWRSLEDF